MKSEAIQRINSFGKAGSIVVLIAKIFSFIGLAACLIASILFMVMPEDFIRLKFDGRVNVTTNLEIFGLTEEELNMPDLEEKINFEVGGTTYGATTVTVINDGKGLAVSSDAEMYEFSLRNFMWVTLMGAVVVAVTIVVLFFAGALCKAFAKCETPFEENVIKKMQSLAISIIPMIVLSFVSEGVVGYVMSGFADFSMNINLTAFIVVLIILMLVQIFKYGAMLQRESDETL